MNHAATSGARLRTIRLGLGLPQAQAARDLGMNPSMLSHHEGGKAAMSHAIALRYAEYYGADVNFLLCRDLPVSAAVVPEAMRDTPGGRLTMLRVAKGYGKLPECARALGISVSTMNHHEIGLRRITSQRATKYAKFFGVTAAHILFGDAPPAFDTVTVVGTICSGGKVIPIAKGNELDPVKAPDGLGEAVVAYVVTGDDLYPVYFHGDVVFTAKTDAPPNAIDVNDRECVVMTSLGEHLIRIVKAETGGTFSLFGPLAPPRTRVTLKQACPVLQINRGQRRDLPKEPAA
jgi:transcriptional regulator with XRE-family HTH domain